MSLKRRHDTTLTSVGVEWFSSVVNIYRNEGTMQSVSPADVYAGVCG